MQRRRKPGMYVALNDGLPVPTRPNHVWPVDFKGWFLLGNGQRCEPLTVCDRCSRYLLACRAQPNQQFKGTLRTCQALMRQAGVPEVIRVDHGTAFASIGLGCLSSLSLWWIEQAIAVEFPGPAAPQDNGSHERMHRDLKAEEITPPSANLAAQQRRFERWAAHLQSRPAPRVTVAAAGNIQDKAVPFAELLRTNLSLYDSRQENEFPFFPASVSAPLTQDQFEWHIISPVPPPADPPVDAHELDLPALLALPQSPKTTWELAAAYERMPINEPPRPDFPKLELAADAETGIILAFQIATPDQTMAHAARRSLVQSIQTTG